jgi:hypothetical protein
MYLNYGRLRLPTVIDLIFKFGLRDVDDDAIDVAEMIWI